MAVDDELDVTPSGGLNSIQNSSEAFNSVALALITSLILANLGSIVSKLMHMSYPSTFTYHSWLRSIIYVNSDDPLRIFSWLRGKYAYRNPSWSLARNRLRPGRMVVPLLGRLFCVGSSFVLIVLSIPREQRLSGCSQRDYRVTWDLDSAGNSTLPAADCVRIPLSSKVGQVLSFAEYCISAQVEWDVRNDTDPFSAVSAAHDVDDAFLYSHIFAGNHEWVMGGSIQWQNLFEKEVFYRPNMQDMDLNVYLDIMIKAVHFVLPSCAVLGRVGPVTEDGLRKTYAWFNCDIIGSDGDARAVWQIVDVLALFSKTSFIWEETDTPQKRLKYTGSDRKGVITSECPVKVSVSQPIVNIMPLSIILATVFAANICVSWATSRIGNAIDAGFHLVKEALGFDSATNPLEASCEYDEETRLRLQQWLCSAGRGHVGFLRRPGDISVDEFGVNTVVGRCEQAAMELRELRSADEKVPDVGLSYVWREERVT